MTNMMYSYISVIFNLSPDYLWVLPPMFPWRSGYTHGFHASLPSCCFGPKTLLTCGSCSWRPPGQVRRAEVTGETPLATTHCVQVTPNLPELASHLLPSELLTRLTSRGGQRSGRGAHWQEASAHRPDGEVVHRLTAGAVFPRCDCSSAAPPLIRSRVEDLEHSCGAAPRQLIPQTHRWRQNAKQGPTVSRAERQKAENRSGTEERC